MENDEATVKIEANDDDLSCSSNVPPPLTPASFSPSSLTQKSVPPNPPLTLAMTKTNSTSRANVSLFQKNLLNNKQFKIGSNMRFPVLKINVKRQQSTETSVTVKVEPS